jgi:hypothetical protein
MRMVSTTLQSLWAINWQTGKNGWEKSVAHSVRFTLQNEPNDHEAGWAPEQLREFCQKKKSCPCHKLNNSHSPLSLVKCGAQIFHSCYLKSLGNINITITNRNVTIHDVYIKTSIWTRFWSTNHEVWCRKLQRNFTLKYHHKIGFF